MPVDDDVTKSRDSLLKSLEGQMLKRHIVHDGVNRPKFIFECPANTPDDGPCLMTEYVYIDATESIVISIQESHYRWKAAWESGFIFDQANDYDPDGNGVL